MKTLLHACQKFRFGLLKIYQTFGSVPSSVQKKKKSLYPTEEVRQPRSHYQKVLAVPVLSAEEVSYSTQPVPEDARSARP